MRQAPFMLLIALALPAIAPAEIYKWTDAQGQVHFSDKPVDARGKPAQPVKLKPDYKPGTDANVRQIYENTDRMRKAATEKTPEQQRAEQREQKQREADCAEARDRLGKIRGKVIFHDDDGKEVKATEKQRAEKEKETQDWISAHCP